MRDGLSRRRLLTISAAVASGMAGCMQGSSRDTDGPNGSPGGTEADPGGPFEALSMDGTTLVVDLREDAQVEQVNVIAPTGSRVGSKSVVTGQTRVTVDLGVRYVPGRYEVTTESGASASISLEPELSIDELGVGANNLDVMPDSLDNFEPYAATVVVSNQGTGPTAIENLAFGGDVPSTSLNLLSTPERSGIVDPVDGAGELESVLIAAGEPVRLFSSTLPFSFAGESQECPSMPADNTISVRISDTISSGMTVSKFEASYEREGDSCTITIGEKVA